MPRFVRPSGSPLYWDTAERGTYDQIGTGAIFDTSSGKEGVVQLAGYEHPDGPKLLYPDAQPLVYPTSLLSAPGVEYKDSADNNISESFGSPVLFTSTNGKQWINRLVQTAMSVTDRSISMLYEFILPRNFLAIMDNSGFASFETLFAIGANLGSGWKIECQEIFIDEVSKGGIGVQVIPTPPATNNPVIFTVAGSDLSDDEGGGSGTITYSPDMRLIVHVKIWTGTNASGTFQGFISNVAQLSFSPRPG